MKEILKTYNTQFLYTPECVNEHLIHKSPKHYILCGMGGSHLPAGILKTIQPGIDLYVHRDYDLPPFSKPFIESSVLIAASFSGNTEEVLSFYKKAKQLYDVPVVCIAKGGELINLAQTNNDPYIILPPNDFVPRTALGYSAIALSSILKDKTIYQQLKNIVLDIDSIDKRAGQLVSFFEHKIPVFYTSQTNLSFAYNWKIKMNETAKKVAFYNLFPESNHNELESYEFIKTPTDILPVLLIDSEDHPRIQKRFVVFQEILQEQNIEFLVIDVSNQDIYKKIFESIVLGDFVTTSLAEKSGVPIAEVNLIEKFKHKLM